MAKQPNAVAFIRDDVGRGDPGCCGGVPLHGAPAPRTGGLAAAGRRFATRM